MNGMGQKLAQLSAMRRRWGALTDAIGARTPGLASAPASPSPLQETDEFGANPGHLRMFAYLPEVLAPRPALVVVLHGCTQNAASYDEGAGWSTLAERYGFALLLPEQRPSNNPKTCFNWFVPADTTRDAGEAMSIRSMVASMVESHGIDPSRIFVTGLSAGGAMTAALLAAYPEVFAAGAVVAGLPHGGAHNVQEALEMMFQGRPRSAAEWGAIVRGASSHEGPWPRLSVWHGTADRTVVPGNADELVKQWTNLHGLGAAPSATEIVSGQRRSVWRDASGRDLVESITIEGMGHGTPIDPGALDSQAGAPGPFLLEAGISSSWHIARFFGIADRPVAGRAVAKAAPRPQGAQEILPPHRPAPAAPEREPELVDAATPSRGFPDVAETINKALRSAGLMR